MVKLRLVIHPDKLSITAGKIIFGSEPTPHVVPSRGEEMIFRNPHINKNESAVGADLDE